MLTFTCMRIHLHTHFQGRHIQEATRRLDSQATIFLCLHLQIYNTEVCVRCMHMQGLCGTLLCFGVKDEIPGDCPARQSIFSLTHTHTNKHRPTLNTKGVWSKQTHTITPSKHTYSHTHSSALPLFSFPSPLLALLLLSLFVLSIVNGDI